MDLVLGRAEKNDYQTILVKRFPSDAKRFPGKFHVKPCGLGKAEVRFLAAKSVHARSLIQRVDHQAAQ